ncbi:MAG: DNA/RNA nuclease SfsA [Sphingomonadales bacterium]|nr:DNA/RNA nuclease SfsA [Sphingomonadales bacterium]
MKFDHPLIPGKLLQRYKRFLADVELASGEVVTAHCMNSGSMLGLIDPSNPVWLSPAANLAAKLKWKWEIVEVEGVAVGINTSHPNRLAAEAIAAGQIPELAGYRSIRREVKFGQENSRVDLLLEDHQTGLPPAYVEVKNVTLKEGKAAAFPDAVTARGAKHLRELAAMRAKGARAVMFYIAQRADCTHFSLAERIDPAYADAFRAAQAAGVEAIAYQCQVSPAEIYIDRPLAIRV